MFRAFVAKTAPHPLPVGGVSPPADRSFFVLGSGRWAGGKKLSTFFAPPTPSRLFVSLHLLALHLLLEARNISMLIASLARKRQAHLAPGTLC